MPPLLIGADVGGTATRVAVADDTRGAVLSVAEQPGGNPNVAGLETAAERIRSAATQAVLQAHHNDRAVAAAGVRSVVLGMSGYATARSAGADFLCACCPDDVPATPRVVSDFAVAYSSGTPAAQGYVVVAGTGAGAAEIEHAEIVRRRDGWGWLLGDQGSAFWLGREAVRAALTDLERTTRSRERTDELAPGPRRSLLTEHVLEWFGVLDLDGLLSAVYQIHPRSLADLAPLPTTLADRDTTAAGICDRAGELLADLVHDLEPEPGRPIVLAGSVLHRVPRVRSAVVRHLNECDIGPGATTDGPAPDGQQEAQADPRTRSVRTATSGLLGALWVAAGTGEDGRPVPDRGCPEDLHCMMTRSISRFENPGAER